MRILLATIAELVLAMPTSAAMLYDNGDFITGADDGAGGAATSTVEDGAARGYVADNADVGNGPYRLRDDFEVTHPDGWQLDSVELFAFETNSGTLSTITDAYVTLYDSSGNLIWGNWDTSLSIIANEWSGVHRVDLGGDPLSTSRPIMRVEVDLSSAPVLPQGQYLLGFSMLGDSLKYGPAGVPKTPREATDNGEQWSGASGAWSQLSMQDFPFKLHGTPEPASLGMMLMSVLWLARRR